MIKNSIIDTRAIHPEPITIASAIPVNNRSAGHNDSDKYNDSDKDGDKYKYNIDDLPKAQVRTVPPRIASKNDLPTVNIDRPYGITLKLFYVLSIVASIWIFCNAKPKYELDDWGNKRVSSHFRPQVEQCCNNQPLVLRDSDGESDYYYGDGSDGQIDKEIRHGSGLCSLLDDDQSQSEEGGRRLEKASPKFLGDEGIFDAFLERPDIILYLSVLIISFTLIWVYSLQNFAKQIIIFMEGLKLMALAAVAYLSLVFTPGTLFPTLCLLVVGAYGTYVYNRIEDIMKAADVITHSAIVLKDNTNMAFNLIGLKVVYSLQTAVLLITICTSYEIVEVQSISGSCYYESPAYLKYINTFQIFVWIWTVWTFDMVRYVSL